ncbi:membrane anchor subunit of succinate dehydrogenase, Sdh4 [Ceratobasidium sp. 395]|nr:membrane anchor subunit of succinate dehydrogenase, Sdh4 [Ceratobasidium sp. 395]
MHGSRHWAFERLLSVALVPMTVSAFAVSPTDYPILDGVLAISLVVHSHIGFDSCVVDYLHSRKFPKLGPIAKWGLRLATTGALVGIYQFNTEDIGLTELVRRAWHA